MILALPETRWTRRVVFDVKLWSGPRFNPNVIITAYCEGRHCFAGIFAMFRGPAGKRYIWERYR